IGTISKESSDRFVTRLIPLQNVRAEDISNAIRSLVSTDGDVVVYSESNTLIIIDSIDNINRIVEIIDNFDVEKKIEFVKIEYAEAGEVAAKLLDIFSSGGSGGGTAAPSRPTRAVTTGNRRPSERGQQQEEAAQSVSGEASSLNFKVITEERTNSLILIAYAKDLAKIKKIISILDVETDKVEEGIYVVRIKNADSEQIVSVLSGLIGGSGSSGGQSISNQNTQQSGTSGLGTGTGALGNEGLGLGQSRQAISRDIGSGGLSAVVASTDGLRITADPATNSIIIVGSRKDFETIKEVIDELDVRRRQVFVEAAILEVNLDAIDSLGANFSLGFTVNGDTLGFGGQNLPGIPSLLGIAADSNAAVNLVGSLSGLFLGVVGDQVDPDGSGPIPPIPSFTALFQALTSVTDVNVLSTPSIITTDNEQAEIVVADIIPFPTGSTVGNAGVTVQTIERLPVGIRLSITPQIGEGDYLSLNIVTEVSSTAAAPTGLNTAAFGIATSTRSADSSVVVKNGQTLVIGGLVQDRESITQNKTPLLGDIPFIGNLFKVQTKETNKLNLMILLTPRIIADDADMKDILEEQQKRKMLLQERGINTIDKN
ncbi:MAG: type II secretion system secretin GspD, partial [Thermodesulfobacteriota bacterium]